MVVFTHGFVLLLLLLSLLVVLVLLRLISVSEILSFIAALVLCAMSGPSFQEITASPVPV